MVWPGRARTGARSDSTSTSFSLANSSGTTSMGMPRAAACSASARMLPAFSLPSDTSTTRFSISGGRIETARRTPAARSVTSREPLNSSVESVPAVEGGVPISAPSAAVTSAN
jgi:hypothetical protein